MIKILFNIFSILHGNIENIICYIKIYINICQFNFESSSANCRDSPFEWRSDVLSLISDLTISCQGAKRCSADRDIFDAKFCEAAGGGRPAQVIDHMPESGAAWFREPVRPVCAMLTAAAP